MSSVAFIPIVLGLIAVFWIHPWEAYPPALESSLVFSESRMIDPGSDSLESLTALSVLTFETVFRVSTEGMSYNDL